jgi:hypothetical protein
MGSAKTLRDENLYLLTDKFAGCIPEELLSLRIDLQDGAVVLHGDDRVRYGFEELAGKQGFLAR